MIKNVIILSFGSLVILKSKRQMSEYQNFLLTFISVIINQNA